MNTYFIANNKTRVGAIYQTDKTRAEVLDALKFDEYDICMTCENLEHALELRNKGDYQLTQIEDFFN